MKRVLLSVALFVALPAVAAAQIPPPPPVPPAAPPPPAPAPMPPVPVVVPRAIPPAWVVEDALRAAASVDVYAIRDATEAARLAVEQARIVAPAIAPMVSLSPPRLAASSVARHGSPAATASTANAAGTDS